MVMAVMRAPKGLGPKNATKGWPTGWVFWAYFYHENMFAKFSGLNPLLLKGGGPGLSNLRTQF